jgi:hypothetical protein
LQADADGNDITVEHLAICVRKGNTQLYDAIGEAQAALVADGTPETLIKSNRGSGSGRLCRREAHLALWPEAVSGPPRNRANPESQELRTRFYKGQSCT